MLTVLPAHHHDAALLVAYSGGLDSTALLHGLAQDERHRRNGLRAVHVHHGLHEHADTWTAHCQSFCDILGVPLHILRVDVARDAGHGLEAAARNARYKALSALLKPGEVLVTAHHQDDQAETFLMRALRASGPDGLAAMRAWRSFARGWHWRPLLQTPRGGLLAYAQAQALQWIEDPSNADTDFDRNFLRQHVLPLLRERWPQADASFARSATLNADAVDLLANEDAHALASVATLDQHSLLVSALLQLPKARRARVLRHWIQSLGLPPLPAEGIAKVEDDLLTAPSDTDARFDWRNSSLRRWRDLLYAGPTRRPLADGWQENWDGRLPLLLPTGASLSLQGASALPSAMRAHARQGGERIILPGRDHSTTLKNALQELGVPPWQRERLPLLSTPDGSVLAAGDLLYSHDFDHWLRGHGARLRWHDPS